MKTLIKLINTLKYLKPKQALYLCRYRILGFSKVANTKDISNYHSGLVFLNTQQKNDILNDAKSIIADDLTSISFLNKSVPFDCTNIDWCPSQTQRLWQYNLHYFDYLNQSNVSDLTKKSILDSWITSNPQGLQPAWEPYTISLRIINWSIYFIGLPQIPDSWHNSLFEQARWLYRNQEYHIQANHYFENLCALTVVSLYFRKLDGNGFVEELSRWRVIVEQNLCEQLNEQFNQDGGHYERSAQYHSILIKRCLCILLIIDQNDLRVSSITNDKLNSVVRKGLEYLIQIVRPDGLIPLFADATFDQTPSLENLLRLYGCLSTSESLKNPGSITDLNSTGYYGYRNTKDWFLTSCADITPCYQPGHMHCDQMSFELCCQSLPFIVDSGVYEYAPGSTRTAMRSTSAHNTVTLENCQQSEIWCEFRVAKRATCLGFKVTERNKNLVEYSGAYKAHSGLYQHHRKFLLAYNDSGIQSLEIQDSLKIISDKKNTRQISCYIHLHPDVMPEKQDERNILLVHKLGAVLKLELIPGLTIKIIDTDYSPQFGQIESRKSLQLSTSELQFNYKILALG